MTKGLNIEFAGYNQGNNVFRLKKTRGKLSLEEITEFLQHEKNGIYQGQYVIVVNATEFTIGGSGWDDCQPTKGDVAELILLVGEAHCPVCSKLLPPDYCAECGAKIEILR